MTPTPSFRDVEKLSAYLDGQLKPSEIARLESRLHTEPELATILKDLRKARGVLRQLPQRRAPRNFTLTPKMVGLKPPLPRTYPVFRFASVLATLLLFITFTTNFLAPRMIQTAAPAPFGYGGGGDAEPELAMEAQDLAEPAEESAAPAAEMAEPVEEPAQAESVAPEEPAMEAPVPAPTEGATESEDSTRMEPTMMPNGVEKSAPGESYAQQITPEITPEIIGDTIPQSPISPNIMIVLAGIALLSGVVALIIRYTAIRKWRAKAK